MATNDVLREALPPVTDYITYLTIIEYNLTIENIAILEELLQDASLTNNIGWDLVALLLPFLPSSEACLMTVARLGNPREVVLKVTEALRLLDFDEQLDEDAEFLPDEAIPFRTGNAPRTLHLSDNAAGSSEAMEQTQLTIEQKPSIAVIKFRVLLSMLSILHPRIKTKRPGSFLATSLQAILAAMSKAESPMESMVDAAVQFIIQISRMSTPQLPPRSSTGIAASIVQSSSTIAQDLAQSFDPDHESEMRQRLQQSFVTYMVELYIQSLPRQEFGSGLAISAQVFESLYPERLIPGKTTAEVQFKTNPELSRRLEIISQMARAAETCKISKMMLLQAAVNRHQSTIVPGDDGEDAPPDGAEDIPLSVAGSIMLLVAAGTPISRNQTIARSELSVFPDILELLENAFGSQNEPVSNPSSSMVLADSLIGLCLMAIHDKNIGDPGDEDHFVTFMQIMSSISATVASESLRYHAHFVCTAVFNAYSVDTARFTFIKVVLRNSPYENLKVSAVSWLKGAVLGATMLSESQTQQQVGLFASPTLIEQFRPYLFPELESDMNSFDFEKDFTKFDHRLSFYMASLNFYYLLLASPQLRIRFDVDNLCTKRRITSGFIQPVQNMVAKSRVELAEQMAKGESAEILATQLDLQLLEDILDRVKAQMK